MHSHLIVEEIFVLLLLILCRYFKSIF